jgi:hypothetical protein
MEQSKYESGLITNALQNSGGDPDKAAVNLNFLIEAGLGRTGAPRRVCTAPAGDPTATPHAGEKVRRHARAARRRDHMIGGGRSRTSIASRSCPSRARYSRLESRQLDIKDRALTSAG